MPPKGLTKGEWEAIGMTALSSCLPCNGKIVARVSTVRADLQCLWPKMPWSPLGEPAETISLSGAEGATLARPLGEVG